MLGLMRWPAPEGWQRGVGLCRGKRERGSPKLAPSLVAAEIIEGGD
jgi:hypothetical protein